MKVYLAAAFSRKKLIEQYREELDAINIQCTSRWLDEQVSPNVQLHECTDVTNLAVAIQDIEDLNHSTHVVLFTESTALPRGGRHFESGYAYGRGKKLIIVGPNENIFHYLPDVHKFDTWPEAKMYLLSEQYMEGKCQKGGRTTQGNYDSIYYQSNLCDVSQKSTL